MAKHLLALVAASGRDVPVRVAGLLLPPGVEITGMQLSRLPDGGGWWIQLVAEVESAGGLELLTKRLNRLVGVHRVVAIGEDGHFRQSVYLRLQPSAVSLAQVGELVRWFRAETLELTADTMALHLAAPPARCSAFVSMLRPYGVIEVVTSAVSGFRPTARSTQRLHNGAAQEKGSHD